MADDSEGDVDVLGKRSTRSSDTEDSPEEKKRKIMKEIDLSLPLELSKTQRKKQLKLQYKERMKKEWKKQQHKKEKLKRRARPSHLSITSMSSSKASPLSVVIELGYQDLMSDKDIKMLMKQCQRCYAVNRRAEKPLQLYFTSFNGKCKQRMEDFIEGYKNWDVHFREDDFLKVFDKKDLVFLTAESPNVLNDLDISKTYVIGGLVDHNHYKGHCYAQAVTAGITHAKLPLKEHVSLTSRSVLAVNHVFEVLLAYESHKDWKKAFCDVIPQRKLATPIDDNEQSH